MLEKLVGIRSLVEETRFKINKDEILSGLDELITEEAVNVKVTSVMGKIAMRTILITLIVNVVFIVSSLSIVYLSSKKQRDDIHKEVVSMVQLGVKLNKSNPNAR